MCVTLAPRHTILSAWPLATSPPTPLPAEGPLGAAGTERRRVPGKEETPQAGLVPQNGGVGALPAAPPWQEDAWCGSSSSSQRSSPSPSGKGLVSREAGWAAVPGGSREKEAAVSGAGSPECRGCELQSLMPRARRDPGAQLPAEARWVEGTGAPGDTRKLPSPRGRRADELGYHRPPPLPLPQWPPRAPELLPRSRTVTARPCPGETARRKLMLCGCHSAGAAAGPGVARGGQRLCVGMSVGPNEGGSVGAPSPQRRGRRSVPFRRCRRPVEQESSSTSRSQ